jgi:hypothetical protein
MGLPVDARLRAREVSRGWRALLNELRFWLVLDFSPGSGVVARLTRALLFAAGERARGHLHTLDLTGANHSLDPEHLVQFVAAHGQSLRSVTAPRSYGLSADRVTRLCRSAPLCTLQCCALCDPAEARPLLRCEDPCALLHIFKLSVVNFDNHQVVLDFAAALPSHSGKIKELIVRGAPLRTGAVAGALMGGIAEAGVSDVSFDDCHFTPASLPGLTQLLQAGCLETLRINNRERAVFEKGPDLTAFCHALRSSTLQKLELTYCQLWRDPVATGEFLAALVGHPTLRELSLSYVVGGLSGCCWRGCAFCWPARRAAGEQLASLITRDSALQKLDLSFNRLGDAGLAPIFEALPRSGTLKELVYYLAHNETISREFARDVILPAVRTNTSLRALSFGKNNDDYLDDFDPFDMHLQELREAEAIVAARTQPNGGAIAAAAA